MDCDKQAGRATRVDFDVVVAHGGYLRSKQHQVAHGRSGVTIEGDCIRTVGCVTVLTYLYRDPMRRALQSRLCADCVSECCGPVIGRLRTEKWPIEGQALIHRSIVVASEVSIMASWWVLSNMT